MLVARRWRLPPARCVAEVTKMDMKVDNGNVTTSLGSAPAWPFRFSTRSNN